MVELISHIILFILLAIIFVQDWKFRAVSWVVFPALLAVSYSLFYVADMRLLTIAMNLFFLAFVLCGLILYISIKRGAITNIFKADFGLGDVLFLVAITPLFMDENFILFFITGMLLSGIAHLIIHQFNKNTKIPLAGYLAVYLMGLKIVDFSLEMDLFNTAIL